VLNTTVTLTGSAQVALARNPRPRANTAVARGTPQPQIDQQYDSADDPVVITPQQRLAPIQRADTVPVQRADDGYIYPADGSSDQARYPAPPSRRIYDTQAQQQQYYTSRGYAPAPQGYYYQQRPQYQPRGLYTYQD
ncbi:MAG: L,D-transpeptidase, partial [Xanthobacteraceae bacterium]|nr:L,D-transpeptidase [Xanthobacteraceae bacterium]